MPVRLVDIARRSGLSVSTVSRILNNKASNCRISKKTAEHVRATANELHYHPNELARGLRVKKTHTIGLIIPDISNPFFSHVSRIIQHKAHTLGYSLIVCNTNEDIDLELEHTSLLWRKGVDGLIVMPVGVRYNHLEHLMKEHVPIVLLDRCFEGLDTSSVIVDNHRGAFNATEHLIQQGHTRIAIIQGLRGTSTNEGRLSGYRDALAAHGIPVNDRYLVGNDYRQANGCNATKLLLDLDVPPTAIFSTSDLITLGVLEALSSEGLRVPDDVSLVMFDDIDFAPYLHCPITAVAQPKENMGESAVKLLIEQMKSPGKKMIKRILLEPVLVVRNSVKKIR